MGNFTRRSTCRGCGSHDLYTVLSYGNMPLANKLFRDGFDALQPDLYPQDLNRCMKCGHLQLEQVVDPRYLYADYPYRTGVSESFKTHCLGLVSQANIRADATWVDIGCNDGTLLSIARSIWRCDVLGVDPAEDQVVHAMIDGIPIVQSFFNFQTAKHMAESGTRAQVVSAQNVLAHVDDLDDFLSGVNLLLSPDGKFVFEVPHAMRMVQYCQFDTVYHEHLSYFLAKPLQKILRRHGLYAQSVEEVPMHGGSLRVWCTKEDNGNAFEEIIEVERSEGMYEAQTYSDFAQRVQDYKQYFVDRISKMDGYVAGFGAAAKASVLLNYCGIDNRMIERIIDDTKEKQGLHQAGTGIPICSWECVKKRRPDHIVIFPWNFAEEIVEKYPGYDYVTIRPRPVGATTEGARNA